MVGRSGEVHRILVCYGGSDPSNETAKALGAIKSLCRNALAVDVVIGLSNPHAESISRLCLEVPGAELYQDVHDMPELLRHADLTIGAAGGMSWKRCCLGLPASAVDNSANPVAAFTA